MRRRIISVGLAAVIIGCDSKPDGDELVVVLPSATLLATSVFVAQQLGLFEDEGLRVDVRTVSGASAIAAVLSGDADFTIGSGPTLLRTNARDQSLIAIANLIDRPLAELVLRGEVAHRVRVDPAQSLSERGRKLKGLTIAVHGVGTMVHAWTEYVARSGGLTVGADLRIIPMEPGAMAAAVQTRLVDGYATSPPFSTLGQRTGDVVMLASGLYDSENVLPFPYGLILTKRDTCEKRRSACKGFVRALNAAARVMHEGPERIVEDVLQAHFPGMDQYVLADAWSRARLAFTSDLAVTDIHLENARSLMLSGDIVASQKADDAQLYTMEFVR